MIVTREERFRAGGIFLKVGFLDAEDVRDFGSPDRLDKSIYNRDQATLIWA